MNNTDKAEESCGIERMPKAYGVKQLSSMNFEYPIPYEKLKICHPTQKVRLLEKRDIVISSLNSDGKIRVYLVNKEPKEDITVGGSCYIVKSQKYVLNIYICRVKLQINIFFIILHLFR